MHRRRPSPSGLTIEELDSSELVALLSRAEEAPSNICPNEAFSMSVNLSKTFMALSFVVTCLFAFSFGCVARISILASHGHLQSTYHTPSPSGNMLSTEDARVRELPVKKLPAPTILPGKEVPYTTYTSKHFQMPGSSTSNTLHIDRTAAIPSIMKDQITAATEKFNSSIFGQHAPNKNEQVHNSDDSGEHLPAGQHLLVDFKDVDSEFLNSEERLAQAMIELTNESKLTLLSYHCHSLVPIGVSCAGVLLESHVAFHTWPLEGVITMDLFTCGGGLLIPLVPLVERLFGVPRVPEIDEDAKDILKPTMLWSHKWRGFRHGYDPTAEDEEVDNHQYQCLDRWVLGKLDLDIKQPVVSTKTKFQAYDVYEVMHPQKRDIASYQKSLGQDDSYEARNPDLFAPDRILFLDGVTQSTRNGDASYHESIVHPALIAHDSPERVAIIGGGEGATMREVLKHNTVTKVVMIEIDDEIVGLSKQYLPEWSDCSNIEGSAKWCFDDERAEPRYEDAMAYFINSFNNADKKEEKYDVIIMDALDPNDGVEFATYLYTDDAYIQSLYNGLTESGILVVQVGEVPVSGSPPDEIGAFKNRAMMLKQLEQVGFKSIHLYEEGHSGFMAPWATLVAFKDEDTRSNWYRNSAEVDIQIKRRIRKATSRTPLLRNFDGSTMMNYQITPKVFETLYCEQQVAPVECHSRNFESRSEVYNPVVERSSYSRQSRQHNFFGNAVNKLAHRSYADADNKTFPNQVPSVYGPEKWIDEALLFFKTGHSLASN